MPRKVPSEKLHLKSLRKSLALIQQELDSGSKDMDLIQRQSTIIRQISAMERRLERAKQKPDNRPLPVLVGKGVARYTLEINGVSQQIDITIPASVRGYLSRSRLRELTVEQLAVRLKELEHRKNPACIDCGQVMDAGHQCPKPEPSKFADMSEAELVTVRKEYCKKHGLHCGPDGFPIEPDMPSHSISAILAAETTPKPLEKILRPSDPSKPSEAPKTAPENPLELVAEVKELIRLMEIKYDAFLRFSNPFIGGQFNEMQTALVPLMEFLKREDNDKYAELVNNKPWLFARLPVDNSRQLAFLEMTLKTDKMRRQAEIDKKNKPPRLYNDYWDS